ncbi:MAG: dipeptide epimerase, partial [Cyanobacteria bacterium P01_A01_bin.68]
MQIDIEIFTVNKRFPLTISRGTTAKTTNLWVKISEDGIEGWGEASPFSVGNYPQTTQIIQESILQIAPSLLKKHPSERQQIEQVLIKAQIPSAAKAAIDTALHDWMGKRAGLPLWQIWGLDRSVIKPISVTIGISSPQDAKKRVRNWLEFTDVKMLKVKLGSPDGIEADRKMLDAVREEAPTPDLYV